MAGASWQQALDSARQMACLAAAQRDAAELRDEAMTDIDRVVAALVGPEFLSESRRWQLAALLVTVQVRLAGGAA